MYWRGSWRERATAGPTHWRVGLHPCAHANRYGPLDPKAAAELLTAVQERYGHQAADAGRSLQIQADDQLELHVDRLRAEQALGNLVENALRHGRGRILLLARRRDGRVELHVRDEGSGFPPDFIDRAFDRFTRSDSVRQGPGAGLGLSIVDVIARAHGGAAHAANHHGSADAWLEIPND